jgi:3-oxoacyl-(acyl-carrier-protein) synthase
MLSCAALDLSRGTALYAMGFGHAHLNPADMYINAHGTSTKANDAMKLAIKMCLENKHIMLR